MVAVMQSMELTDDEKDDAIQPIPTDKPDYPYGLRICLTQAEMEKLDLDPADAFIGGMVHLHAMATITSASASDGEYGSTCRIELQITHLCVESEDEENAEYD